MATSRAFSEELLREILLSLPVKSLLRFKCVCKNWGSLINNPSFTVDHLNLSKKKKPPQHLIYDYGATDDAPTVTLVSDKGIDEQNFQRFGDNITNMLGSIDGVFFIERQIDNAILCTLWNPANREVRHLPATTISFEYFICDRHLVFGLDPMTKDYKVIYYNHMEEYAAIYSCSRDSWKIFKHNLDVHQNPSTCVRNFYSSVDYLNGYYYWLIKEVTNKLSILSFDFGNEVFVEMEGPSRGHEDYNWSAELMLLGDSVGILNSVDGFVNDVWVMIQLGVWNKLLTIHLTTPVKSFYDNSFILVTKSSRLVSYNVRTNKTRLFEYRHPGLKSNPQCGGCGVYYYKESLVTIKRQGNSELHLSRCLTKVMNIY
ncbi:F-box/kelch-repeat protein At3g23880-like [Solanum stenotomum]|uniref:F-box/kelch-repeat protein At3g23880-like n=1 Tax=Solanum stenotomum TaxID=172797 RepID=UPI0020D1384F|nr:F-box/kelch-repeat protein At3g23880-like [Solanum stenotomum]